jgi:hypothetical protein
LFSRLLPAPDIAVARSLLLVFTPLRARAQADPTSLCYAGEGGLRLAPRHRLTVRAEEPCWLLCVKRADFVAFFSLLHELPLRCDEARRSLAARATKLIGLRREHELARKMDYYDQSSGHAWNKLRMHKEAIVRNRDPRGTLAEISMLALRLSETGRA